MSAADSEESRWPDLATASIRTHSARSIVAERSSSAIVGSGRSPGSAPAALVSAAGATGSEGQKLSSDIKLGGNAEDVPDLDVTIHYFDPEELGEGLIIIHSQHIGAPVPVMGHRLHRRSLRFHRDRGHCQLLSRTL